MSQKRVIVGGQSKSPSVCLAGWMFWSIARGLFVAIGRSSRRQKMNVKGTFLMCKYAMPALCERKGSIVNMSSYVGLVGFRGASAYAASKAVIVNLTCSMALDHAQEGVRINAVRPGSVDTEMIHAAWEKFGDVDKARRLWAEKHPMGRIAGSDEVAQAIFFLASDEASFITGTALAVDGLLTAG